MLTSDTVATRARALQCDGDSKVGDEGPYIMTTPKRLLLPAVLFVIASLVSGCSLMPGSSVTNAATVVYAAGASQYTAAVELQVPAAEVFDALVRTIKEHPEIEIIKRNDKARLIEVSQQERRITGQVSSLGSGDSLLYIWADAGSTGEAGREIAMAAVEFICNELGVDYEIVTY